MQRHVTAATGCAIMLWLSQLRQLSRPDISQVVHQLQGFVVSEQHHQAPPRRLGLELWYMWYG